MPHPDPAVTIDLRSAVQQAMTRSGPLFNGRDRALVVELPTVPLLVHGDLDHCVQVIALVIEQAAAATPPGGRVSLALDAHPQGAVVRVRQDQACTVEAEADIRQLVALRRGMAYAFDNDMDKGSTHHLSFGLPEGGFSTQPHAPVRHGIQRVLVVDDNADIVLSTSMLLRRWGYTVETAANGKEAVAKAEGFAPDIVLMDIGMPEMNGYEAARHMRQQPWGKHLRIVAITGWGQDQDVRLAYEAGFDKHLVKPVDRTTLLGLLTGEHLQH